MRGIPYRILIVILPMLAARLLALPSPKDTPTPSPSPTATLSPAPILSSTTTSATINSPSPSTSPSASPSTNPAPARTAPAMVTKEIPGIRGSLTLPADWTYLPGKVLEGDVILAVREKIKDENDSWTTGMSMTLDRNGASDSGMKPSEYALGIASEAHEKAGEEASPISQTTKGAVREIRFEFPIASDPPIAVTEILRANDTTGTVAIILWQCPREEAVSLRPLRDAMLSGLILESNR